MTGLNNTESDQEAEFAGGPRPGEPVEIIEVVSLEMILAGLRRGLGVFTVCVVLSLIMGLFWIATADRLYEARVTLTAPIGRANIQGNSMETAAIVLRGLDLAGGSITSRFSFFRQRIFSPGVAQGLAADHDYLKKIFSARWNKDTQEWAPPHSAFAALRRFLRRGLGLPAWAAPTDQELLRYLRDKVNIEYRGARGLRLIYRHTDPELAKALLSDLILTADLLVRREEQARSKVLTSFLQARLSSTTDVEARRALTATLIAEESRIAASYSDLLFSAAYVDRPTVSNLPVSPRVAKSLTIAGLIGIFLGLVAGFARFMLSSRDSEGAQAG